MRADGEFRLEASISKTEVSGTTLFTAILDIHGRKALDAYARVNSVLHTLANNMSQLAWMADSKGWIFWYNQRWFDYTVTTLKEMEGWGWKKVHHPDHVDRVVARIQKSWDSGAPWEDSRSLSEVRTAIPLVSPAPCQVRDGNGEVRWFGPAQCIDLPGEHRKLFWLLRTISPR